MDCNVSEILFSNENSTEANNQESTGSESHNSFEVQNHKVLNSTLNVDAQEFVPKSGSYQSYSSFENQVNPVSMIFIKKN